MSRREKLFVAAAFGAGILLIVGAPLAYRQIKHWIWPVTPYRAVFNRSVEGLAAGDAVEIRGVTVGRVVKVGLTKDSPPRIAVDMEINSTVPIRRDAIASVASSPTGGQRIIDIRGGNARAGRLEPGQQITTEDFSRAQLQAEDLRKQAHDILSTLSGGGSLESPEKKTTSEQLVQLLDDSDAVMRNLRTLTADLARPGRIQSINATLDNLHEASKNLAHATKAADISMGHARDLLATFANHREELSSNLNSALKRLNLTLDNAQQMMSSARQTMSSANHLITSTDFLLDRNSVEMQQTLDQVARATVRLNETLQTIQDDPSVLLWGRGGSGKEPQ